MAFQMNVIFRWKQSKEIIFLNYQMLLPYTVETWSENLANYKAFIMSYDFMLSWLHRAQIFWSFAC